MREIEQQLLDGEADLAIHSLKDLPVRGPKGLDLVAFLPRDPAGDVMIFREKRACTGTLIDSQQLSTMGPIKIATGSLRRRSLLLNAGAQVEVHPLRGNVDTRLKRLKEEGLWDAIILAEASIARLDLASHLHLSRLDPHWFTPSPAQGILALQCLEKSPLHGLLKSLGSEESSYAARLERLVLEKLGGDCTMPIGVHASRDEEKGWKIQAAVLDQNGRCARIETRYTAQESLEDTAEDTIHRLISAGVNNILSRLNLPTVKASKPAGNTL